MYSAYFIVTLIVLAFVILIQLIRMTATVMKINKSKELNQTEIKEDKNWEFIKGLY